MRMRSQLALQWITLLNFIKLPTLFAEIKLANDESLKKPSTRTNFCAPHRQVERGKLEPKNGLRGQTITVGVKQEIDKDKPYLAARVLHEVARRAQFKYVPYVSGALSKNETWTEVLFKTTEKYDLAIDWYMLTVERLRKGIIYPENWYDADTVLVIKKAPPKDTFIFWVFSYPFSNSLWTITLITIFLTGLIYYFLEVLSSQYNKLKNSYSLESCLFTSVYSFTGSRNLFKPKSTASWVLIISMAFLYLILCSAYTANLTNHFVVKNDLHITINDINDVIRQNLVLCVVEGFITSERIKKKFPTIRTYAVKNEQSIMKVLSENKCDVGLITKDGYDTFKDDPNYSYDCDIDMVGRNVFSIKAGFALYDSQELCTSLLENVLTYHIVEMKDDGTLEELMRLNRDAVAKNSCVSKALSKKDTAESITIRNIGGIFAFHIFVAWLSLLIGLIEYFIYSHNKNQLERKNQMLQLNQDLSDYKSSSLDQQKEQESEMINSNNRLQEIIDAQSIDFDDIYRSKNISSLSLQTDNMDSEKNEIILKLLQKISDQSKALDEQKITIDAIKKHIFSTRFDSSETSSSNTLYSQTVGKVSKPI